MWKYIDGIIVNLGKSTAVFALLSIGIVCSISTYLSAMHYTGGEVGMVTLVIGMACAIAMGISTPLCLVFRHYLEPARKRAIFFTLVYLATTYLFVGANPFNSGIGEGLEWIDAWCLLSAPLSLLLFYLLLQAYKGGKAQNVSSPEKSIAGEKKNDG